MHVNPSWNSSSNFVPTQVGSRKRVENKRGWRHCLFEQALHELERSFTVCMDFGNSATKVKPCTMEHSPLQRALEFDLSNPFDSR